MPWLTIGLATLFGVLLLAVVTALIFDANFRRAVLTGEGETKLLGIFTARGTTFLVICGMFVFGAIYPLTKLDEANLADQLEALSAESSTCRQSLEMKSQQCEQKVDTLAGELNDTQTRLEKLVDQADETARLFGCYAFTHSGKFPSIWRHAHRLKFFRDEPGRKPTVEILEELYDTTVSTTESSVSIMTYEYFLAHQIYTGQIVAYVKTSKKVAAVSEHRAFVCEVARQSIGT